MSKTIYVNEYPYGGNTVYQTEDDAKQWADRSTASRIAVPYREVDRRTLNKTQAVEWAKKNWVDVIDRPHARSEVRFQALGEDEDGDEVEAEGPTYVSAVIALRKKLGVKP